MICTKQQEVKRRTKDGSYTYIKCINPISYHYSKEVNQETCSNCPVKQERKISGCDRRNRKKVTEVNGLLQYDGETPEGFKKVEGGLKSMWPSCAKQFTNNTVTAEGVFLPIVYCDKSKKVVSFKECNNCFNNVQPDNTLPPITTQAKNYAKALYGWVSGGFESRSDEEVNRIFAICKSCEKYNEGRCSLCGCALSAGGRAVTNKIKMASEHCPISKW